MVDTIPHQTIVDTINEFASRFSERCARLAGTEQRNMKNFLSKYKINAGEDLSQSNFNTDACKLAVVNLLKIKLKEPMFLNNLFPKKGNVRHYIVQNAIFKEEGITDPTVLANLRDFIIRQNKIINQSLDGLDLRNSNQALSVGQGVTLFPPLVPSGVEGDLTVSVPVKPSDVFEVAWNAAIGLYHKYTSIYYPPPRATYEAEQNDVGREFNLLFGAHGEKIAEVARNIQTWSSTYRSTGRTSASSMGDMLQYLLNKPENEISALMKQVNINGYPIYGYGDGTVSLATLVENTLTKDPPRIAPVFRHRTSRGAGWPSQGVQGASGPGTAGFTYGAGWPSQGVQGAGGPGTAGFTYGAGWPSQGVQGAGGPGTAGFTYGAGWPSQGGQGAGGPGTAGFTYSAGWPSQGGQGAGGPGTAGFTYSAGWPSQGVQGAGSPGAAGFTYSAGWPSQGVQGAGGPGAAGFTYSAGWPSQGFQGAGGPGTAGFTYGAAGPSRGVQGAEGGSNKPTEEEVAQFLDGMGPNDLGDLYARLTEDEREPSQGVQGVGGPGTAGFTYSARWPSQGVQGAAGGSNRPTEEEVERYLDVMDANDLGDLYARLTEDERGPSQGVQGAGPGVAGTSNDGKGTKRPASADHTATAETRRTVQRPGAAGTSQGFQGAAGAASGALGFRSNQPGQGRYAV